MRLQPPFYVSTDPDLLLDRLKDNYNAIETACKKDLGKGIFESGLTELDWCTNDIVFVCTNLKKWARDESAPDIPLVNKLMSPTIRKDPLGCVLVIGYESLHIRRITLMIYSAYNFPVQLLIGPLIGAIAAGNTAVAKPSENAPNVAAALQKVIETSLDPTCFKVVQGAIPETTALLDQKWDKIFYTGSATVGTIIAKKAAETLTPVTLELGGKNPAIITRNANVHLAARRLLWGKVINAGQVCISHNYTLVDKEVLSSFVAELKAAIAEFYPNGTRHTDDFGRIVNNRQWIRLKKLLDASEGKILIGGEMDEEDLYMAPTVVQVDSSHDSLVAEESFGPLLPILPVENLDEAIRIANEVHDTPLGLYPFGNKTETDRSLREIRSGGASVNDTYSHGSIPTLAFGGVGDSGQGAYRGRASFDCFSHRRSIVKTPGWMEAMLSVRYPPYNGKLAKMRGMSELKPNFNREGKITFSLANYILTLGAGSVQGGLLRFVAVLIGKLILTHRHPDDC